MCMSMHVFEKLTEFYNFHLKCLFQNGGLHIENIKSQYLQNLESDFMQFASKWAVFQILLDKIHFPLKVAFRQAMYNAHSNGMYRILTAIVI